MGAQPCVGSVAVSNLLACVLVAWKYFRRVVHVVQDRCISQPVRRCGAGWR